MTHNDVASIYKAFQTTFLTEGKKRGPGDEDLPGAKGNKKIKNVAGLGPKEKGPGHVKGLDVPVKVTPRKDKKVKKPRKMAKESINTGMSMKNLFDRLYEEVMDDESALGIDTGEDFDSDVDLGDEGDEVTVTLPREVAQQLCDSLKAMLGEGEGDLGEDEGTADDFDMGEQGSPFPEGVEFQKAPDGVAKLTNRGNNKVNGATPVSSGGGDGKYTDKVGEDGDYGHSLVNPKKGHGGKSDHGNMKVKARRPGAPGSHAFGN